MPNWIRWFAVLPAALLASVLSAFPLHWALYGCFNSGVVQFDSYPETPERVLLPFVVSMAFVWAGARVAPKHTFRVALVLCVAWLLVVGVIFVLAVGNVVIGGLQFNIAGGGLLSVRPVMSLSGAVAGLFYVYRKYPTAATGQGA